MPTSFRTRSFPYPLLVALALAFISRAVAQEIADITRRLTDSDFAVRHAAAEKLGERGAAAETAVPALIAALRDPDHRVRATSAWALGKIQKPAGEVAAALVTALGDADWTVRHNTALALTWMGAAATPHLEKAVADRRAVVRLGAADTLLRTDPTRATGLAPMLLALLADADDDICYGAARALTLTSEAAPGIVDGLLRVLDRKNPQLQATACEVLGGFGQRAAAAAPRLVGLLTPETAAEPRIAAAQALAKIGAAPDMWVPAVIQMFQPHRQEKIAAGAQIALVTLGRSAVPYLVTALEASEQMVREQSAEALGTIGPAAAAAVPALSARLRDSRPEVRQKAAYALGQIGTAEPGILRALEALASDPDEIVRTNARGALAALAPTRAQAPGTIRPGAANTP
jgi:HEAT repeat protein